MTILFARARHSWLLALLVVYLVGTPQLQAGNIALENFESYPAGSNLNGGSGGQGWTGNWVTLADHVTVQMKTLSVGNNNGGSQASRIQPTVNTGSDSIMRRAFPGTASPVYVSFLVRTEGGDLNDLVQIQVSDGSTGNVTDSLSVGINNTGTRPFFARVGKTNDTTNASVNAANDTDYFLVAKFSIDGGAASFNRTDLFLNPTSRKEGQETPIATRIGPLTGLTQLSLFNVRVTSLQTTDAIFLDNIQVGDSFRSVTPAPEPSSLALVFVGLGALALCRRRRKAVA